MYSQYAVYLNIVNRSLGDHIKNVGAHIALFSGPVSLAVDKRRVRAELIVFFACVFGLDLADDGSFALVCGLEGLLHMDMYLPAMKRYYERVRKLSRNVVDSASLQQLFERDLGISSEYIAEALTFLRNDFDIEQTVHSFSTYVARFEESGFMRLVESCEKHLEKLDAMPLLNYYDANDMTKPYSKATSSTYLTDIVRKFMCDVFAVHISPATMDACVETYPLNYRDSVAMFVSDMRRDIPEHEQHHRGAHFAYAWINLRCFFYNAFGVVVRRDEIFEIL